MRRLGGSIGWKVGVKRGPARPASRELTFALERWRSANVPYRKSKSARALPSPSDCGLGHRRKRSQKLRGIDYVAATIQLAGREPATFDCSVDCRLGDAYGRCCTAWCVHLATCALRKTSLSCSHAVVPRLLVYPMAANSCAISDFFSALQLSPRVRVPAPRVIFLHSS